jgi:hypothetical protein
MCGDHDRRENRRDSGYPRPHWIVDYTPRRTHEIEPARRFFHSDAAQAIFDGPYAPDTDIPVPLLVMYAQALLREMERLEGVVEAQQDAASRYIRLLDDFDNLQDEYTDLRAELQAVRDQNKRQRERSREGRTA